MQSDALLGEWHGLYVESGPAWAPRVVLEMAWMWSQPHPVPASLLCLEHTTIALDEQGTWLHT